MIFTELVLQNFGPYAGRNIINLNPEVDDKIRPIILFGGMNGGGKTTLMDAIRLALYGQRARCSNRNNINYNDFLIQSVNNQTSPADSTRIELAFEHPVDGAWKRIRIVRHWTKYIKDGKDNLGIIEEDWPGSALANTWDEYIETILPLGISNLFLFDGEQVKELAEQDIPPTSVIDAIQSLLGLELPERLAVDLEVLVNRKRKKLASAAQLANLEQIEEKINHYKNEYETAKENLASLQNQLNLAREKHDEAANKFRNEGGKIAANRNQLDAEIKNLSDAIENQRQEMRNLAAGVLPLNLIVSLLKQAAEQGHKEIKIQQAKVAKQVLIERDKKLLDYLENLSLALKYLQSIQKFLEKENQELDQEINTNELPWLNLDEETLKQLDNLLSHQLHLQSDFAHKQLDHLQELTIELDNKARELAVAASPEAYQKLDENLKKAQQELVQAQAKFDAGQRKCNELQKAFEKAKKELEQYSQQTIDRQNDEHLIKSAARVQQTLQVFKERLTLKKLNKLEGEVTECFRYLLHKSDLVHRIAIDTLNFSLSLYDPEGQSVPKHRLSAGEKQLLSIAFLWGLARVSGRNLPVAIDTPLGRLDSSHRNNLVERYFPTASHQVILLSTDTEIGLNELNQLQEQDAIARRYLLEYDSQKRQTLVCSDRYFW